MGVVKANIKLSNAANQNLQGIETECIVDTVATSLCIPETIAMQLELNELQKPDVKLADGSIREVPYVGPIKIEFENRIAL